MDQVLSSVLGNFLSPAILAFILGALAGFLKSDLEIPEAIAKGLSIYLMFAIGLKGGASLAASQVGIEVLPVFVAAFALSFFIPFVAFYLLKLTTRLSRENMGGVAAHYGSVSIVTYVTATEFLKTSGIGFEAYMVAVVALMETPAIISGLMLAQGKGAGNAASGKEGKSKINKDLMREILFNGSIVLLLGGFAIGWVTGPDGLDKVSGLFVDPFQGVLCLFLLDMGLVASHRIRASRALSLPVVVFGLYMPVIGAGLGMISGFIVGLSAGGIALLAILSASASYIAVPAAMRLALPKADPGLYIPLSLGITFPFNIVIGIPLYTGLVLALVG